MVKTPIQHQAVRAITGEDGIAIFLMSILVVTILFLLLILFNVANYSLISAELRVAADAAAHAGAANICSKTSCWERSRLSAIETLNQFQIRNNIGQTSDVRLDASSGGPTYTYGNLSVTVERGFWLAGTGGPGSFVSFETAGFPGVPKFAVTNAVRVTISRTNVQPLLSSLIPGTGTWRADTQATALASEVRAVDTAPFAIPVCSLIDSTGEFNPSATCTADRVFTSADRYCPIGDPNCGILPGWTYDPLTEFHQIIHDCEVPPAPTPITACGFTYDTGCGFRSPVLETVSDQFGVVGIAGSFAPPTEIDVVNQIRTGSGSTTSAVGMPFAILPGGLTSVAAFDAMSWQVFSNSGDSAHPRFRDTPLTRVEHNLSYQYPFRFTLPNFTQNPVLHPITLCSTISIGQQNNGVCNSARLPRYTPQALMQAGQSLSPAMLLRLMGAQFSVDRDAFEALLWSKMVPVIADFGSGGHSCQGVDGAAAESAIETGADHNWATVGYLQADIFDFDIGSAPPAIRDLGFASGNPGAFKISFDSGNCNEVRARLRCAGDLIPTSDPAGRRRVVMVQ